MTLMLRDLENQEIEVMTKQSMSSLEKMREIVIEEEKAMGIMEEERKFIRPQMASRRYSIGRTCIMKIAKQANALYKIGSVSLINVRAFEDYIEAHRITEVKG